MENKKKKKEGLLRVSFYYTTCISLKIIILVLQHWPQGLQIGSTS
jgi:hypothetical protein